MNKSWISSMTVWGAILVAAARTVVAVAAAPTAGDKVAAVVEGVGIIMAAKGARTAIAKNGNGQ